MEEGEQAGRIIKRVTPRMYSTTRKAEEKKEKTLNLSSQESRALLFVVAPNVNIV